LTRKKSNNPVYPLRTIVLQESLRAKCIERNDDWGKEVLSRIEFVQDLVAAEAVYHQKCSTLFRTRKDLSDEGETQSQVQKRGDNKMIRENMLLRWLQGTLNKTVMCIYQSRN